MQDYIVSLIIKHLNHSASFQEEDELVAWLEASEENKRFYSLFVANYSLHSTVTSDRLGDDIDTMLGRLDARIDAHEAARRRPLRHWPLAALAAVAAALALILFLPARQEPVAEPSPALTMASNITDDTIHLVLEDGTRVYLRPGAKISYNVAGLADSRVLNLEGDAYFDVARDETRPFTVSTHTIGVKVLGTAFSVSSSPDVSQVVLERGSVRLLSPEGYSMITLSPNQKATYLNVNGDMRVESVYATAFVTDKYNLVSMSDATLREIIGSISKLYKVKISYTEDEVDKRYNIAFLKSDSVEDVLAIVQYLSGSECKILHK